MLVKWGTLEAQHMSPDWGQAQLVPIPIPCPTKKQVKANRSAIRVDFCTISAMAGLAGVIRNKPPPHMNPGDGIASSYAMAVEFPPEADRLFDGELSLLLMDGLLKIAV